MVIQLQCNKGANKFDFLGETNPDEYVSSDGYVSSIPCVVHNMWPDLRKPDTINRASQNFQYNALNVIGEILAYFKKYYGIFLKAWFVEKERSNNKNLDTIWFAYSRGVRKSLFLCSRPKDMSVMGVCLRHVKTILRDRFFLTDFAFVCSEERWYTEKLTQYLISLFMANTMVQIVTQYILLFVSYHHFSKRM